MRLKTCQGCGVAIAMKAKRCAACMPAYTARERARQASQPYRKGYGWAYRKARERVIKRDRGVCRAIVGASICGKPAVEVHHVVPLSQGGSPTDESMMVAVCRAHNPRGGAR